MTIYIDVVLFENMIMNYIIILATGIIMKQKIRHFKIIVGSLIGAIYSILTYVFPLEIYSNFFFKIILSIIIVYVSFNPQNVKKMWKELLIFYLTSFAFGGAAFALIYIIKPQDILMKNGLFLGLYPLKTVLLAGAVGFIIVISSFKIVKAKISKKDVYKDVKIVIDGKELIVKTMIDTGNMLKDPITGSPVIILEHTLLYDFLPKELLNNIENILAGKLDNIPKEVRDNYMTKLKFIPFSSLGKQNGMLIGIKPSYVEILQEDEKKYENMVIGIYNKSLTKTGEYRALMGINCF